MFLLFYFLTVASIIKKADIPRKKLLYIFFIPEEIGRTFSVASGNVSISQSPPSIPVDSTPESERLLWVTIESEKNRYLSH